MPPPRGWARGAGWGGQRERCPCIPAALCPSFGPWDPDWAGPAGRKHLGLGAPGLGAQVPQRSGGFVYKQWGSGSPAPPGGQCGRGGARVAPAGLARVRPFPSTNGRVGVVGGGTEDRPHPGRAPARPPAGGGDRGRWRLRLPRAGAAPQQQPVIGPARSERAGRSHVAAWGRAEGVRCDSRGAAGTARVRSCVDLQGSRLGVLALASGSRVGVPPTPRCWRLSPGGVSA